MKRKWGQQVKFFQKPLEQFFEMATANGLRLLEFRAPTRNSFTVAETDLMADPETRERLRALSEERGIELAYHAPQRGKWHFGGLPFDVSVGRLRECIVRSVSIGARIMTLHLGLDDANRLASIRNVAEMIQAVAPFAEEKGVLLCIENVFGIHSLADVEDFTVFFERATCNQIRLTLDTGHAQMHRCLFEMLERFHDRLAFTHLHDNDGVSDQHLAPGNGSIDWGRFMCDLDLFHYRGPLCFEYREKCSLAHCIEMLKKVREVKTTNGPQK